MLLLKGKKGKVLCYEGSMWQFNETDKLVALAAHLLPPSFVNTSFRWYAKLQLHESEECQNRCESNWRPSISEGRALSNWATPSLCHVFLVLLL